MQLCRRESGPPRHSATTEWSRPQIAVLLVSQILGCNPMHRRRQHRATTQIGARRRRTRHASQRRGTADRPPPPARTSRRAVVAHLLECQEGQQLGQSTTPSAGQRGGRPCGRDCRAGASSPGSPATVSSASTTSPLQTGMTDIEADPEPPADLRPRSGVRCSWRAVDSAFGNHLHRDPHPDPVGHRHERLQRLQHRVPLVVAGSAARTRRARRGAAPGTGTAPPWPGRAPWCTPRWCARAARPAPLAVENGGPHVVPCRNSVIGACTLCSRTPGVGAPATTRSRAGLQVVVVDVGPRGEDFDRREAVQPPSPRGARARAPPRGTGAWRGRSPRAACAKKR